MESSKKTKILSNIMLIIAAAIWGSNFIFQKNAATEIGPFLFMSVRSYLGAITLIPIIWAVQRNQEKTHYDRKSFLHLLKISAFCGCVTVSGSVLVQTGLMWTNASKAGFLNAIYIIFVPVLGVVLFKKKSTPFMWLGIALASVGLYYLCLAEKLSLSPGDLVILCSTLFFALHIHLVAKFVHQLNGMHMVCLEFFSAGTFCLICSFIFENPAFSQIEDCAGSILFAGIFGIGVCYALQVNAQKHTDPTVAALLMSLESVFSAIGGTLILHEVFTFREFIGVIFIIAAIIIAQLPSPKKKEAADESSAA